MGYNEWSIDWLIEPAKFSPAKTQRRKGKLRVFRLFFASLRLCGRISFLILILSVICVAQPLLPMRAADIVKVANVTAAQMSPNGQWVVYPASSVDEDKNVSTLWLAPSDTRTPPRTLLPSGWTASNPRWSPDSNSIAFLSTHEEQDGLWVIKLDKPEPRFIAPITTTNFLFII